MCLFPFFPIDLVFVNGSMRVPKCIRLSTEVDRTGGTVAPPTHLYKGAFRRTALSKDAFSTDRDQSNWGVRETKGVVRCVMAIAILHEV